MNCGLFGVKGLIPRVLGTCGTRNVSRLTTQFHRCSSTSHSGRKIQSACVWLKVMGARPMCLRLGVPCLGTGESCRSMGKLAQTLVNKSPQVLQPYLRLMRADRPIGAWLLFWPAGWSTALAANAGSFPDVYTLFLMGTGAFVARGAGCVINDIIDRDIDKQVARTCTRPIASGQIGVMDAVAFLGLLLATADVVLMQLNWYSVVLGASSLGLIATYPFAKRIFHWPQLMLGFVFNWGALVGWSAVQGSCNWVICAPLYLACVSWTMVYDTIYAHQDKEDDAKVKVKSTALSWGDNSKSFLVGFTFSMGTGLALAGYMCDQTFPYYLSIGIVISHTLLRISKLDLGDPQQCSHTFESHSIYGLIVMIGIITGNLLKIKCSSNEEEEIAN